MKTKLHSLLIYPLIITFAYFLKGKKKDYQNFFISENKKTKQKETLEVISKNNTFFENIKFFFDKQSPVYDKTLVKFDLDIFRIPEERTPIFDFFKVINVFHAMSMLSAKIPNGNLEVALKFKKGRLNNSELNNFLRYSFLTFASRKVDKLYFDKELLMDEKSLLAYQTMISYVNNSTIVNFSNAKSLYVITCKKGKDTFDIIWSSGDDIELTEFNKVYDKYGNTLSKDIKITNNPIYAFHQKS
jgi:hypothetical protein